MNKEELAEKINGSTYNGFYKDKRGFFETAKENNLIIIAGCSDDLIEIRGSVNDETGEGVFHLGRNGVVEEFESAKHNWNSEEDCFNWFRRKKNSIEIRGDFGEFWKFAKPSVDFASFSLYEGWRLFSEGLIIDKNDLSETLE